MSRDRWVGGIGDTLIDTHIGPWDLSMNDMDNTFLRPWGLYMNDTALLLGVFETTHLGKVGKSVLLPHLLMALSSHDVPAFFASAGRK